MDQVKEGMGIGMMGSRDFFDRLVGIGVDAFAGKVSDDARLIKAVLAADFGNCHSSHTRERLIGKGLFCLGFTHRQMHGLVDGLRRGGVLPVYDEKALLWIGGMDDSILGHCPYYFPAPMAPCCAS